MNRQTLPGRHFRQKSIAAADSAPAPNGDLSRLIAAAVVDQTFRALLLDDPREALESTYGTETFHLTDEEKKTILSVQCATSLADFAMQLVEIFRKTRQTSNLPNG